ncbi:hypothetical protein N7535_004109 [Penicillium sp. DV-2018c]|nr:hypothetical protein N7535_004109 [Penicillium sp. DV-2018c]
MSPVQQYWLPGYCLSRHIVLGHIHYFLGPSATVRPYSYQGREGYLINGVPITRDQIDDLMVMSREYERQEAARMVHNASMDRGSRPRLLGRRYSRMRFILMRLSLLINLDNSGDGRSRMSEVVVVET